MQKEKLRFGVVALAFYISILFVVNFVFATFDATTIGGQNNITFTFLDDTNPLINITINNTGPVGFNFTEVIIVLDKAINFTQGSNDTDASGHNATYPALGVIFNLTAAGIAGGAPLRSLNWSNVSIQAGDTNKTHFWFNITTYSPGKGLNISVFAYNDSGGGGNYSLSYNITLNINDSINIDLIDPTNITFENISLLRAGVGFGGNETAVNVSFLLYNSTGFVLQTNLTYLNFTHVNFTQINTSALSDGTYYLNATVNNTQDDQNVTATRTFIFDTLRPSMSVASRQITATVINLTISVTESGSGVVGLCTTNRSGASVLGAGNAQEVYESGLTCSTSYGYNITCTDHAGNLGETSISFSTTSCGSGAAGSGTGAPGSSFGSAFWDNTYIDDDEELSVKRSVFRILAKNGRSKIKIDGETHFVGVIDLDDNTVTINVSSDPQQEIFEVGESNKFDVTEDNFYDLDITLNEIKLNKANVTISYIHEGYIPEERGEEEGEIVSDIDDVAGKIRDTAGKLWWLLALVGAVLLGIASYFLFLKRGFKKFSKSVKIRDGKTVKVS